LPNGKGAGAKWAGSKLKMASPVDFSTKKIMKVKVWSPVAKKLLLKLKVTGQRSKKKWLLHLILGRINFDFTGVAG
jgi:hypothetical protein